MKKIIIIGATSGIGRASAKLFARRGWLVGAMGRRRELLDSLKAECSENIEVCRLDVTDSDAADTLLSFIDELGGVDVVLYSSAVGYHNTEYDIEKELEMVSVNVESFTRLAHTVMERFFAQRRGHFAAISSIAGVRGTGAAVYGASKAYMTSYLESLRVLNDMRGAKVLVTELQPGFVDTAMGQASSFWRISAEESAEYIVRAIEQQREHAYISPRWRYAAWAMRFLPHSLMRKILLRHENKKD